MNLKKSNLKKKKTSKYFVDVGEIIADFIRDKERQLGQALCAKSDD